MTEHKSSPQADHADPNFLINEGLDLLAGFRAIKSREARTAVIGMIAAIVQAEEDAAAQTGPRPTSG